MKTVYWKSVKTWHKLCIFLAFIIIMLIATIIYVNYAFSLNYDSMKVLDDDHISKWEWDDPRLIDHIRKYYLHEPATLDEPYRLTNPDLKDWSARGESKAVLKLLAGKQNGFFVECGAYDGETYSNSLPLEKYYNWTGLLIEADYGTFKILRSKRRKAWAVNACIHPGRRPEKKEFIASLWTGSLAEHTTLMKHITIRLWRPVRTMRIWCFPLYSLLLAVNRTTVDYFSLDMEGGEMDVIRSTPFGSKINLKMLEVEYAVFQGHFDKDLSKKRLEISRKHFRQLKGFKEAKKLIWDIIFVNTTKDSHID